MKRNIEALVNRHGVLMFIIALYIFIEQLTLYHYDHRLFNKIALGYYIVDVPYFIIASKALMPYAFSRKRPYLSLFIACLLALVLYGLSQNLLDPFINVLYQVDYSAFLFKFSFVHTLIRFIWLTTYAMAYFFGWQRLRDKIRIQELELNNRRLKLLLLRSVINPHFISNTVARIIAAIAEKATPEAELLRKLDRSLSYGITHLETEATVREEIQQVERCIELHSYSKDHAPHLNFSIQMTPEMLQKKIPPMLLTNPVENIFTHGILNDPQRPAELTIAIEGNRLRLFSKNLPKRARKVGGAGIGIGYVEEVLASQYAGRYEFSCQMNGEFFEVKLVVEL